MGSVSTHGGARFLMPECTRRGRGVPGSLSTIVPNGGVWASSWPPSRARHKPVRSGLAPLERSARCASLARRCPGGPLEEHIRKLLQELGEDPDREGLARTPHRVAEALRTLTRGYSQNAEEIVNGAIFTEKYDEMVIVKDIDLYSMCEHHLLPFYGKCHVAYIPNGKIIGLSKIPRIVEMFGRRLQVQERLTQQVATCLEQVLEPKGVAVVTEAYHLCMAMRGVEKQNANAVTSAMTGIFLKDYRTRDEFLGLIRR
jgi:GTP cyclohydrolase I